MPMAMENLPIDIHTSKLCDWLVSRRHCDRGWQEKVMVIREKINHAIQDMPEHPEIIKLLSGSHINYFHCLRIVDILRETEADTKNMFGRYGSQRMKDWQEVVRLYERDNIYLAEAAQMLVRNVTYEVTALKRQIAKCDQIQTECDRKETECGRRIAETKTRYDATCRQLGISGIKVKSELVTCLRELPAIFVSIADGATSVQEPAKLYREFTNYTISEENVGDLLPLLQYLMDHGNTTTYEWRYGEPPIRIEEPVLDISMADEELGNKTDEIDFGDSGKIDLGSGDVSAGNDIDFGQSLETGEIDWGGTTEAGDPISENQTINMDISLEDAGIVVEDSGLEGGIARDSEALTLLDNPKTRNSIVDELMELEAFLAQRLAEIGDEQGSVTVINHFQSSAPASLQLDSSVVSEMLTSVRKVLRELTDVRLQHLCLIKSSPRYVDRLAESVKHQLTLADKLEVSREAVRARRQETLDQQKTLQPQLKTIIEKTRELQGQIEADISKRYKNRPVNIMGEINTM